MRKRAGLSAAVLASIALATGGALGAGAETAGTHFAAPPGYTAARAAIVAEGRKVAALIAAGDADSLFARFTPQFARMVPKESVQQVLEQTLSAAPIGARVGESALPLGLGRRFYIAEHRWGARTLTIQVSLDAAGSIGGLLAEPIAPLRADPRAGYKPRTKLSLPFQGLWWVFWGGPTRRQNYHVIAPDQRHAYDLVVWRGGGTHRGKGTANADYWAWGQPILAPADARVVAIENGARDNRPQVELENRRAPAGNHIVLDFGNGEFALLAHMRRGSVRVRPGQKVKAGQVLGVCGNSGNSSEPHLHFHVQDRRQLFGAAKGLPVAFIDYRANGVHVRRGAPVQGDFIRN